ncbi:HAD-IB family hydrolase [Acinetobacter wuhouensis]|uniref:HAD-IB family hydrolase n=1 Tax=Acinetobacter wuhouensis TaxID=1879050 RepID=A0A4Q7AP55_9GAMM|nr:HAD-IB family hydrolase [Acinetobacter wuhouensis]RZG46762.1 HAD-IB family hydrolase [Acinetobacter wuhouensis]RZG71723.1 HAD-IB family hydrolase [Acinetobacter wuhouensis]
MHATSKTYKNLALFDFDGTLCKKDSFTGFIFYALSKRHIVKQGIKILPWIQAYYLNIYPAHAMRIKLFKSMFKDANTAEILDLTEDYCSRLIEQLDPSLYQRLIDHQNQGDDVVLVSASVDIYLEVMCQILKIDLICTETEIINGIFTGDYSTPDCSSEQKRIRILEKYELDQYENIYAYGNSIEDNEMLSLADFKYMVGEDQNLPRLNSARKLA